MPSRSRIHTISQGECLASLAHRYGFSDPRTIYDHPDNASLREQRDDPFALLPGDEVAIPDPSRKTVDCAAEALHKFKAKKPKTMLRIVLRDGEGQPISDLKYRLTVGETIHQGTTGGDGLIEKPVPANATAAELVTWSGEDENTAPNRHVTPVQIGHLDPARSISGVQGRLANLGYPCRVTGEMDGLTRAALRDFQEKKGLDVTGELDDQTRDKISGHHDKADGGS